jgi:predicted transcriptional regulator/plasmid maintenance system antidote protein VapI
MVQDARRKILAGSKVRRLRSELGLSQTGMAGELGISVSYLNLVERNERPLTAQLLIRLSETYGIDPRSLAQEDDVRSAVELEEVFADAIFKDAHVPRSELRSIAENSPGSADAIKRLYRAFVHARELRPGGDAAEKDRGEPDRGAEDPIEQTRSFLEQSNNYFEPLELKAEQLAKELAASPDRLFAALAARLLERHGIRVEIMPFDGMRRLLRHYDRHRRKLMLSELLGPESRTFQAAFHLGLSEATGELDETSAALGPRDSDAAKLARVSLCNYFAAALMMPYARFAEAAAALSYDLDVLCARFCASYEQVAHRLTTLSRPSQRGVPFFLIRVDAAGNVSKRFSSGAFPFSRFGGTCARWSIHGAFMTPGRIVTEVVEMPDGSRWLSISRTVDKRATPWGEPGAEFVIGLGCELKYAHRLVYGTGVDIKACEPTPIGINCRMCGRPDCPQRAAPAMLHKMSVSESTRGLSPFWF